MAQRKHEKLLAKKLAQLGATTDALERLTLAHEIQKAAVALQLNVVAEARGSGLTWTQIGSIFGMTKQAAQQRFKTDTDAKRIRR